MSAHLHTLHSYVIIRMICLNHCSMVRVLLVRQLWDSQRVVGLSHEPLDIVQAHPDLLVVATRDGCLCIYRIQPRPPDEDSEALLPLHQFNTRNQNIFSIKYSPATDR